MRPGKFNPKEALLSLTAMCNLKCAHCDIEQKPGSLDKKSAIKFLVACSRYGIKRIGFTGGEPFLVSGLMRAIVKEAARQGMLFSRIMTNGAWLRTKKELALTLGHLSKAGYDGGICLSFDAFHRQDIKKCASLIRTAAMIWRRSDMVSIAAVKGVKDRQTRIKFVKLARYLRGHLTTVKGKPVAIRSDDIFIRISYIDISPIGKAAIVKNAWDGRWFKDDMCKGPGNVLFVLPDGKVRPCCGYASDSSLLTIGSIKKDSPGRLIDNARKNDYISSVLRSGLHPIRKHLERLGVKFTGKTTNHCFFCNYLIETIPWTLLKKATRYP